MNWAPSVVELSDRFNQSKDGEGLLEAVHVNTSSGEKFGLSGATTTLTGPSVNFRVSLANLFNQYNFIPIINIIYL